MNTIKKTPQELLVSKGIKPTYPRLKILEYLQGRTDHPTADMIYRDIVRKIPTMSRTTVYNTMHLFLEQGILRPVMITGTEVRCDLTDCFHHHFLCEECGAIIDVDLTCPNCQKQEIEGHQIRELHGYFKGVCKTCAAKTKS